MDFGGLNAFHDWAKYTFDHTMLVARDDPHLELFKSMSELGLQDRGGLCDLRIIDDGVGCEKFAKMAYEEMTRILRKFQDDEHYEFTDHRNGKTQTYSIGYLMNDQVRLRSVEVFEHAGNSATYQG
jgi:6-pyruvoyltetrahydropterin/6-carboxytetrahydropterin synthase